MDTTVAATVDQNKQVETTTSIFGSGRYSALMVECYKDSKRMLGLDDEQAIKLAKQIGSDFGAAMRDAVVEAKTSKSVSKDGKITLSEAAKVKGITTTNALTALRVMQYMNEAGKFHIAPANTQWAIVGEFKEYLENL